MNTAMNSISEVQKEYQRQLKEVSNFFACGSLAFDYRIPLTVVDYCGLRSALAVAIATEFGFSEDRSIEIVRRAQAGSTGFPEIFAVAAEMSEFIRSLPE